MLRLTFLPVFLAPLLTAGTAAGANAADMGCTAIQASGGEPYRWAVKNPAMVAPVLLDYEYHEYKSPLMSILTQNSLVINAPADITANFNLTDPSGNDRTPQKYVMQSIEFRKPAAVPEGTSQALSHVLEVVLVHKEVTGTGYFANVILPFAVNANPGLDILAPLLKEAELPKKVGEAKPVLVSTVLPMNLVKAFENVSFQHFWAQAPSSCNNTKVPVRILMRNTTIATSSSAVQTMLEALEWAPVLPPVNPPEATWLVEPCARGATCTLPAATDPSSQLDAAKKIQEEDLKKLEAAKTAMDASLAQLTANTTNVTNEAYDTAIKNKEVLRNAEAAADGADRTVKTLQSQIDQSKSAVWDSDAPPQASSTASQATDSSPSGAASTTAAPAVAATPALLATKAVVQGCQTQGIASPLDVDLAHDAEHVDASAAGPSEALLFWRLSATPALEPAQAAAAETAAEAPQLRVANLGDRLRVTPVPEDKPLMVLLLHGQEVPITFADVSVPGEHGFAGQRPTAEVQLVHAPAAGGEAIAVAVQLDEASDGADNVWLGSFLSALPRAGQAAETRGADPMALHGAFARGVAGRYYRYTGRLLQNSPCVTVKWNVLEERSHLSRRQLSVLQGALLAPGTPGAGADPSALQSSLLAAPRRPGISALLESTRRTPVAPAGESKPSSLKGLLLSLPRQKRASEAAKALTP